MGGDNAQKLKKRKGIDGEGWFYFNYSIFLAVVFEYLFLGATSSHETLNGFVVIVMVSLTVL